MKILRVTLVVITILLIIPLTSCGKINDLIFRSMDNLPKGEFVSAHDSPSKEYTLYIYLCGGNATTDFSIRGELVNNSDNNKNNIYWSYHEQEAEVEWIDEDTIVINEKTLDILKDVYDFRK